MEQVDTRKGVVYTCKCAACGTNMYTHEWTPGEHNELRDAMQNGTRACDFCRSGRADPDSFTKLREFNWVKECMSIFGVR
jgi:hypothetical protein